MDIASVYKPAGITPLEALRQFKRMRPELKDQTISYAGRLDPMAEGVMLLLIGEENKNRKTYEALPKRYAFEVLFGVATDTYDALGIITKTQNNISGKQIEDKLPQVVEKIKHKKTQLFPPYSSRTVHGKPLFYWARRNLLSTITIPEHPITIFQFDLLAYQTTSPQVLKKRILRAVEKVKGDFRQEEIIQCWDQYFSRHQSAHILASAVVECSSGTYIRSLCHEMGEELTTGAIALSIKREAIGEFHSKNALKIT